MRLTRPPFILAVTGLATAVASAGKLEVFGLALAGWCWLVVLMVALVGIGMRIAARTRFPLLLFAPFFFYVALRTDYSDREEFQRYIMLWTPVLAGYFASIVRSRAVTRKAVLDTTYGVFTVILIAYAIAATYSGEWTAISNWFAAPGFSMTLVLVAAVSTVAHFESKSKKHAAVVAVCFAAAFMSQSRNPVLVIPTLFLLGYLRNVRSIKVIVVIGAMLLAAHIAFYQEAVQQSLFRSGSGTYSDLLELDAADLRTGGRLFAWPIFLENIPNWWVGGGSASSARFGREYFFGRWAHPHNEYIRVVFDYGLIGLGLLMIPLVALYRRLGDVLGSTSDATFLANVMRLGLIGMALLAATGNVLVYMAWYGNLLFCIGGFAFNRRAERGVSGRAPDLVDAAHSARIK